MKTFAATLITLLFSTAASALPQQCDMNNDGVKASMRDYVLFFDAFGGRATNEISLRAADLDHDGKVDVFDYGVLLRECPINFDAVLPSADTTKINPGRS